jgi:hypothetical protein
MDDDLERLANDERLFRLFRHYHEAGGQDREAWHDRVMEWDDGSASDLVRCHGLLLAANWLELNAGVTPVLVPGRVAGCYRVTPAGRQAMKRLADSQRDTALSGAEVCGES